jgi:geranylgeranyl reductase family protein
MKDNFNGYDIIVVGAGPAGCIFAEKISDKFNVLLLDKSTFPREKPCGGMLVEESQEIIKDMNPPDLIFSNPKFIDVRYLDWNNNIDVMEERKLWNISRKNFDYWLLEKVKEKVNFLSETTLLDVKEENDHVKLFLEKNGQRMILKCKYLVCADGSFSMLRRKLFNVDIKYYIAVQKWLKTNTPMDNVCYFIYDNDITDFYSWVLPKRQHVILGSAFEPGEIKGKISILENKVKEKINIEGKEIKLESSLILKPISLNNIFLGENRILFIGESAGLISSSTGEGISFALRSGEICARSFNLYYEDVLEKYKKLCAPLVEEVSKKMDKSAMLSDPAKRRVLFGKTLKEKAMM